jgi:hypothetical protein
VRGVAPFCNGLVALGRWPILAANLPSAGYNQLEIGIERIRVGGNSERRRTGSNGSELLNNFFAENVPEPRRGHTTGTPDSRTSGEGKEAH